MIGAGPALDMCDQPVADLLHVVGKIELGDGFAVAAIGHIALSGLEIVTPMIVLSPPREAAPRAAGVLPFVFADNVATMRLGWLVCGYLAC